ncbi:DNA adenine methylase [Paenibacillus terrae]|uniref:DNA adenine methylase n=1 Tax=Paenibacillus terrae TaxID=159743 RepID=UPI000695C287|nr:DNA adenine methylase [Paenibacillus terrae]
MQSFSTNSPFNTDKPKSTLRYIGGKCLLSKHIIPYIPEHYTYCEVFGGGGHVLTQKAPSKVEIYNDIDYDLVNFLMMLRSRRDDLIEALVSIPTSRHLYETWAKESLPEDNFQRAVIWYYLLRQMIIPSNNIPSGWRSSKIKSTATDYQNSIRRLNDFEKRLRTVMIERLDFRECILRYDSPETFFFVDSPYYGKSHYYKGNFSEKDFRDLADMLHNIKGKCLVTYYGHPFILELYKGWRFTTLETKVVSTITKASKGEKKRKETEYLFMNFEEEHVPLTLF